MSATKAPEISLVIRRTEGWLGDPASGEDNPLRGFEDLVRDAGLSFCASLEDTAVVPVQWRQAVAWDKSITIVQL